jgi:hypothetical protein
VARPPVTTHAISRVSTTVRCREPDRPAAGSAPIARQTPRGSTGVRRPTDSRRRPAQAQPARRWFQSLARARNGVSGRVHAAAAPRTARCPRPPRR